MLILNDGGHSWLIEALKPDGAEMWLKAVEFRDGGQITGVLPLTALKPDGTDVLLILPEGGHIWLMEALKPEGTEMLPIAVEWREEVLGGERLALTALLNPEGAEMLLILPVGGHI